MLLRDAMGGALRETRTRRGLTLRQLAEASKVSVPYLSEIERGRKEASSEILATVCRVLDLSLAALLVETGRRLGAAEPAVLDLRARREQTSVRQAGTRARAAAAEGRAPLHSVQLLAA